MDKQTLLSQLKVLKQKQKQIDAAWEKAGNRHLLEFFIEIIPKAINVDRCSIFIVDPMEDNLWVHCGTGLKERQIRVPTVNSLVGKVIETGQFQVEMDMENLVGAHDSVDLRTGFISRNSLVVPVRGVTTSNTTGAIQVLNKRGDAAYTEEDIKTLEKLAFQIQMIIENLFLKQQLARVSDEMGKKIKLLERQFCKIA